MITAAGSNTTIIAGNRRLVSDSYGVFTFNNYTLKGKFYITY
jgi:hypothetical protein